jgi:hypothetical protein
MDEIVEAFAGLLAMFARLRLQRLRIPLGGALQRFGILRRNSPSCTKIRIGRFSPPAFPIVCARRRRNQPENKVSV